MVFEALAAIDSPFSGEQRRAISTIIRDITTGTAPSATLQSRHVCKEQRHLHLHDYLRDKLGRVLRQKPKQN